MIVKKMNNKELKEEFKEMHSFINSEHSALGKSDYYYYDQLQAELERREIHF